MVIYGQLTKSDAPVVWCSQCLKDSVVRITTCWMSPSGVSETERIVCPLCKQRYDNEGRPQ